MLYVAPDWVIGKASFPSFVCSFPSRILKLLWVLVSLCSNNLPTDFIWVHFSLFSGAEEQNFITTLPSLDLSSFFFSFGKDIFIKCTSSQRFDTHYCCHWWKYIEMKQPRNGGSKKTLTAAVDLI